jgi:hypothetical protein
MTYLVYWYGSKDRKDFYGFVPQLSFITHDDTKSLKKLKISTSMPPKLREKQDAGTALTSAEEEVARTFREYEEDLQKEPKDRVRGDVDFPEEWELLTLDDIRNVENGLDSEDSDVESKEVKVKRTKKKSKKVAYDNDDHDDGSDDEKQQSKVARKRKQAKMGALDEKQKLTTKKRGSKSAGNLKAKLEDSPAASDAEVLPKKKRKLNATKAKKLKKEETTASGTPQTTQEEKTFKLCKQAFLPAITRWKTLLEEKDVGLLIKHLEDTVQNQIKSYSAPFIVKCGVQDLARQTKGLLVQIPSTDDKAKAAKPLDVMLDEILKADIDSTGDEKPSTRKKKKSDKSDDSEEEEEEEDDDDDDGDDYRPAKSRTKGNVSSRSKKAPAKKRKKSSQVVDEEQEDDSVPQDVEDDDQSDRVKSRRKGSGSSISRKSSATTKKKSRKVNDDEENDSDKDDAEDDYQPDYVKSSKKDGIKRKNSDGKSKKVTVQKKSQSVKHKRPAGKGKNRLYSSMVDDWKAALKSRDVDVVYQCIKETRKVAVKFRSDDQFFAEMHLLLKVTKAFLNEDHPNVSFLDDAKECMKDLKQTLKELYNAKNMEMQMTVPSKANGSSKSAAAVSVEAGLDESERSIDAKQKKRGKVVDEIKSSVGNGEHSREQMGEKIPPVKSEASTSRSTVDETLPPVKSETLADRNTVDEALPLVKSEASATEIFVEEMLPTVQSETSIGKGGIDEKASVTDSTPSTIVRRKSKGGVSSTSGKPERKKILKLGNMLRSDSKALVVAGTEPEVLVPAKDTSVAAATKTGPKQVASWVVDATVLPQPSDDRRQTALVFLHETRSYFGSEVQCNFESVCLSLEAAVFDWANATHQAPEWENAYWTKIHGIVAALSSKAGRPGSLVKLILEGDLQEARDIVGLDLESLTDPIESLSVDATRES